MLNKESSSLVGSVDRLHGFTAIITRAVCLCGCFCACALPAQYRVRWAGDASVKTPKGWIRERVAGLAASAAAAVRVCVCVGVRAAVSIENPAGWW